MFFCQASQFAPVVAMSDNVNIYDVSTMGKKSTMAHTAAAPLQPVHYECMQLSMSSDQLLSWHTQVRKKCIGQLCYGRYVHL